jgi:hypothetical protein
VEFRPAGRRLPVQAVFKNRAKPIAAVDDTVAERERTPKKKDARMILVEDIRGRIGLPKSQGIDRGE